MAEVRYSLNGKYFKSYGVIVSESKGLADVLKRKKVNTYDWAEYHGVSVDLSNPKYEAREIELRCFIMGDNWQQLFDNFNIMIRDEFAKSGTQRLLIEPMGHEELVYDVFMQDSVSVDKTFAKGKMIATFSLKLIEPNPVKKVLKLVGDQLQLAFNSDNWVDINIDGINTPAKGAASMNKTLEKRVVVSPKGQNIIKNSTFINALSDWVKNGGTVTTQNNIANIKTTAVNQGIYQPLNIEFRERYFISFEIRGAARIKTGIESIDLLEIENYGTDWNLIGFEQYSESTAGSFVIYSNQSSAASFEVRNIRIATQEGQYAPTPSEVHFITLAGNINEITGLTTNATILWQRL